MSFVNILLHDPLQALTQPQLKWQMDNSCVDFDPMSEVMSEDVGANQAGAPTQKFTKPFRFFFFFFLLFSRSLFLNSFAFLSMLTRFVVRRGFDAGGAPLVDTNS